jgi:hypothetical protein
MKLNFSDNLGLCVRGPPSLGVRTGPCLVWVAPFKVRAAPNNNNFIVIVVSKEELKNL